MKKIFVAALLLPFALGAFAQEQNASGGAVSISDRIESVKQILENIEGYVFLEIGEDKARDLSETFGRTISVFEDYNSDQLKDLHWDSMNKDIAWFSNDNGNIFGKNYGETIVTVTEKDGTKHRFIVFVCPTVTVISPDGAVYTHQKIYNQKLKIDFSQSDNFNINTVMASYDGQIFDVTDSIDPQNGHMESERQITSDVEFTVTLEEDVEDVLLGNYPIRLGVLNGKIYIMTDDDEMPLDASYLSKLKVEATTMRKVAGEMIERSVFQSTGAKCIDFNSGLSVTKTYKEKNKEDKIIQDVPILNIPFNDGLYFIKLDDGTNYYNYKIIIRY